MTQYIDKTALVAEVEKHYNECLKSSDYWKAKADTYRNVLTILDDTLEVKEVDLEDDVDNILESYDWNYDKIDFCQFAKHFFELGLKVKQESNDDVKIGETQIYFNDSKEQPYVGNSCLDLSCMKYETLKTIFKDGDNVEILIRKTQKGE